jgi:hypothetical protein
LFVLSHIEKVSQIFTCVDMHSGIDFIAVEQLEPRFH